MSGSQPQAPSQARVVAGKFMLSLGGAWRRGKIMIVCVIVVGLLLITWTFIPTGDQQAVAPYRPEPTHAVDAYAGPVPPPAPKPVVIAAPAPTPPPTVTPAVVTTAPVSPFHPQMPQAEKQYVYSYGAGAQLPEYLQKIVDAGKPAAQSAAGSGRGGIDFKPVTYAGTKTFTIPNRDLMLMRWTTISCVLDTQVVTGAGGDTPFKCHTDQPVRSPTGVVLLEAGTIVGGTYKSLVGEGDKRVIAVTADAQSPNGVIADIGGPVADELGAAGVPGSVDEHWGQRIGGALLLALADTAISTVQSYIQRNSQNTNISLNGGSGSGDLSGLANQLLSRTISIPPTITLNQGQRVQLWVTKYVDFSDSYRLEAK